MKVSEVCSRGAVSAPPEATLAAVARQMQHHNVGAVVVLADGRPVGIVTDRDLALALGARGASPLAPVEMVMTRRVLAVPQDADVLTAARYIRECGVRRLPVVDGEDRVIGVVSLDDLLRLLARELTDLAEGIRREMEVK
jgi:CBS domain-containing protein